MRRLGIIDYCMLGLFLLQDCSHRQDRALPIVLRATRRQIYLPRACGSEHSLNPLQPIRCRTLRSRCSSQMIEVNRCLSLYISIEFIFLVHTQRRSIYILRRQTLSLTFFLDGIRLWRMTEAAHLLIQTLTKHHSK